MSEKITHVLPRAKASDWMLIAKSHLATAYTEWVGKDVLFQIKPNETSRSVKQNRLLWKWHGELAKHIHESQGEIYDTETIHEFVIGKLLPKEPKKLPDGDYIISRKSTKTLPVKEFAALLDMYCSWVLLDFNCKLTTPDDLYWDAVMKENPRAK